MNDCQHGESASPSTQNDPHPPTHISLHRLVMFPFSSHPTHTYIHCKKHRPRRRHSGLSLSPRCNRSHSWVLPAPRFFCRCLCHVWVKGLECVSSCVRGRLVREAVLLVEPRMRATSVGEETKQARRVPGWPYSSAKHLWSRRTTTGGSRIRRCPVWLGGWWWGRGQGEGMVAGRGTPRWAKNMMAWPPCFSKQKPPRGLQACSFLPCLTFTAVKHTRHREKKR